MPFWNRLSFSTSDIFRQLAFYYGDELIAKIQIDRIQQVFQNVSASALLALVLLVLSSECLKDHRQIFSINAELVVYFSLPYREFRFFDFSFYLFQRHRFLLLSGLITQSCFAGGPKSSSQPVFLNAGGTRGRGTNAPASTV